MNTINQTGGKVMKTRNNVRKASLNSIVVLAGYLLGSILGGSPALAKTSSTHSFNALLAEETEKAMELEAWMTNESNFFSTISLDVETEKANELEAWMTNESNFFSAMEMEAATEKVLELEDWMLNDNLFSAAYSLEEANEGPLKMESWMLDNPSFEKEGEVKKEVKEKEGKNNDTMYGSIKNRKKFGTRTFLMKEEKDPKLEIETWMIDYRYWNGK